MNRFVTLCVLAFGLTYAQPLLAEDSPNAPVEDAAAEPQMDKLSGVVSVVGSAELRKTILVPSDDGKGQAICMNNAGKKIRRLGGMTVDAEGFWVMNRKGTKRKCFQVQGWAVTKTSSGRAALVGVLEETAASFVVRGDDGKVTRLDKVPKGLRKLAGKRVILDIKSMHNLAGESAAQHVVSYSEFP